MEKTILNSTKNSLKIAVALTALVGVTAITTTSTFAAPEEARLGKLSKEFEAAKTDAEITVRTQKILERIAGRTGLSRQVIFQYLKDAAPKWTEASEVAWTSLLNKTSVKSRGIVSKEDFENADLNADLISGFVGTKNSKSVVDDLPFSEVDLNKLSQTFDVKQKSNFARVLKRTAELVSSGATVVSMKAAFEQALKELGYYDEYMKHCK